MFAKFKDIFILIFLICFSSLLINCSPKTEKESSEKNEPSETPELADYMMKFQYFQIKLGLALQANNIKLADFYIHELDEVLEALQKKNITDDEIVISPLLKQILEPAVDSMLHDFEKNIFENYTVDYKNLITSCNNCHATAKHEFIVIEEPKQSWNGQNFLPQ